MAPMPPPARAVAPGAAARRRPAVRTARSAARASRPGLAPHPQAAWTTSAGNPLVADASPRLLETLLGAGIVLESITLPGLPVPLPEIFVILLLALASFRPPRRDLSRFGLLGGLALGLLAFLVVETVANGLDPTRRAVRIGVLILFVAALADERLDVKGVLYGMAGAGLLNVPLFYAGLVSDDYGGYLTGFLGDKNVAGLFYALMPALLIATVQRGGTKLVILAAGFGLTFLTGSRTSLAALFCAAVWILLSPYLGRVLRLLLLVGMGALVSWAEENLAQLSVFGDRTGTDWLRAQIQAAGSAKAAAAPWYGDGLSTATVDLEQGTFFFHNSYLGLITEGGWIFLVVVVGAYALLCLRPFSQTRRTPSRVALEAAAVVVLVTSLQLGEVFITTYGAIILGMGLLLTAHEATEAQAARAVGGVSAHSQRILERARRQALRTGA